ncbi:B-cell receptor CD22-like, partial [Candoia aspera]|uniref:B-cell receptor CD22-like n=1 Tax=Candoia aspera TaxID=51853 RepID=UPI002FD868CD
YLIPFSGSLGKPLSVKPLYLEAWEGSCVYISCSIGEVYEQRSVDPLSLVWYFEPAYEDALKDYKGELLYKSNSNQIADSVSPAFSNRVAFVGDLKDRNCSLKISHLRQNDTGMYGIRLYWKRGELHSEGQWLEKVSIKVHKSPSELIEIVSPEMEENKLYKLACWVPYYCFYEPIILTIQGLGDRPLSQKRTNENQKVRTELSLQPTWKDHGKQLTCLLKTHNGREIKKNFTKLEVKYAPKGVRLNADLGDTVKEGDNLSLECIVNSSNPNVHYYEWLKDGYVQRNSQGVSRTEISGLNEMDSGNYACRASNWIGRTVSENLMINVQYPPKVNILTLPSFIKEKDNVVLRCSATGNPPITGYEWYRSSMPGIINTEKELQFEAIRPSNSDTYLCVARNEIGNSSSSVTLKVHYCPKDVQLFHLNHLPIKEGDKVILKCSVGSSVPSHNWYNFLRSDAYIQKGHPSSELGFVAEPTPITSYGCEACNIIGCTFSPPITLDVLYGPKDVKLNQEPLGRIIEGSSLRLSCTVKMANPQKVSYTWYKNGQLLPLNSTENMIFFQNAHSTNSGIYHCTAKNTISIADSPAVRLDVYYGPRNVHLTLDNQQAVTEGMDVFLRCDNDAYPSAVFYKWYWKGQEIFKESSKILALHKIKVEQSGEYLCKAYNSVSDTESQLMTISVSCEYFPYKYMDTKLVGNQIQVLLIFVILHLYHADSGATVMKHTLIGLGVFLPLVFLTGLLHYGWKKWKKTMRSDIGSTQRSNSFFVRKAKREVLSSNNCRLNEGRTDRPVAFHNEEQEDTISYARLQFPPTGSKERTVYFSVMQPNLAPGSSDDRVVYSVLKKPALPPKNDSKVDYENVVNKEEEELHYSSLVNLAPQTRPINVDSETDSESQDSIQYAALKH